MYIRKTIGAFLVSFCMLDFSLAVIPGDPLPNNGYALKRKLEEIFSSYRKTNGIYEGVRIPNESGCSIGWQLVTSDPTIENPDVLQIQFQNIDFSGSTRAGLRMSGSMSFSHPLLKPLKDVTEGSQSLYLKSTSGFGTVRQESLLEISVDTYGLKIIATHYASNESVKTERFFCYLNK